MKPSIYKTKMKQITHIDGLSGQEEALAIEVINEEVKTTLYNKGPQPIEGSNPTVYICPICGGKLEDAFFSNGPDDYYGASWCKNCNERWDD